ncbi:type 1 glutamine amidotransferase [Roseomonas elaeocarpi]|uniref:Type 1 glutamine amidotransferase n=1 Tax=Roseomonas elaeocarpi TaxID=907779 RepID=A0ABV6JX10_9PROT
MRIGILECGLPPAPLLEEHGSYDTMVRRLLRGGAAEADSRGEAAGDAAGGGPAGWEVVSFRARDGVLPEAATACDAYVLTGSPAGVYDPLPWIPPLLEFLRNARGRAKLVGICFGHQAMAQAFGGEVIQSPRGWGVGLHRYALRERRPWMGEASDAPAAIAVPASHQDQVVQLPPGARVTVASEFTPFAGLDYGDAISFQFHPEFSPAFGTALTALRRDTYPQLADAAIASYGEADSCERVDGWIRRFLAAG